MLEKANSFARVVKPTWIWHCDVCGVPWGLSHVPSRAPTLVLAPPSSWCWPHRSHRQTLPLSLFLPCRTFFFFFPASFPIKIGLVSSQCPFFLIMLKQLTLAVYLIMPTHVTMEFNSKRTVSKFCHPCGPILRFFSSFLSFFFFKGTTILTHLFTAHKETATLLSSRDSVTIYQFHFINRNPSTLVSTILR